MRKTSATFLPVIVFAAIVASAAHSHSQALAQAQEQHDRLDLIRSGMVLNFLKFTGWPAPSDATAQPVPLVLAVLGSFCLHNELEATLGGQTANGRIITIRRMQYPSPAPGRNEVAAEDLREFFERLRGVDALYICDSEERRVRTILSGLRGADVLTISSIANFAELGGMLGLTIRDGRVAFDANVDEIRQTRLKVSSKLLRLARIVSTRETR